jgi:hypothetical protein
VILTTPQVESYRRSGRKVPRTAREATSYNEPKQIAILGTRESRRRPRVLPRPPDGLDAGHVNEPSFLGSCPPSHLEANVPVAKCLGSRASLISLWRTIDRYIWLVCDRIGQQRAGIRSVSFLS